MLTSKQMLKIDPELAELSEADLSELQQALYDTAQLAFEVYWTKKHGSKNPLGLLANSPVNGIMDICDPNRKQE